MSHQRSLYADARKPSSSACLRLSENPHFRAGFRLPTTRPFGAVSSTSPFRTHVRHLLVSKPPNPGRRPFPHAATVALPIKCIRVERMMRLARLAVSPVGAVLCQRDVFDVSALWLAEAVMIMNAWRVGHGGRLGTHALTHGCSNFRCSRIRRTVRLNNSRLPGAERGQCTKRTAQTHYESHLILTTL